MLLILSFHFNSVMVSELASFVPYHALFPMDRGNIKKKNLSHFSDLGKVLGCKYLGGILEECFFLLMCKIFLKKNSSMLSNQKINISKLNQNDLLKYYSFWVIVLKPILVTGYIQEIILVTVKCPKNMEK